MRYSGASVGPQVAAVFAGGFAPLIATALIGPDFDRYWLVALYMVFTSVITIVGALWSPETAPQVRLRRGLSAEHDPTTGGSLTTLKQDHSAGQPRTGAATTRSTINSRRTSRW